MNLHALRIFTAVARHNSFSQAAKALYISQPAVSKSVQELEEQLGVILLDRSHRKLKLTEAGNLLFDYAQRLFAIERGAETALEQLQNLERGHLAIGASHTVGTYMLPPLLGIFQHQYPKVRLSLDIANTQRIINDFRRKPLDLAFIEGSIVDADLEITPWQVDRMTVIVAPDHPLLARQPVSFAEFAREPYIQRDIGSGTREIVQQVFKEHGTPINVAMELGSNQVVKQAVIAGLGISIVSAIATELERKSGVLATLVVQDLVVEQQLSYVTLRGRPLSRATAAFISLLIDLEADDI